jgi:ferredoxin/flavodoxin
MKGIICYYSGSGNTKLACQYLAKKITAIEFRLFDIINDKGLDLAAYDLAGFAAFADYLGPSRALIDFVRALPKQQAKPAFVFNTFGSFNGATLRVMAGEVSNRGFNVIAGHALHMPENIPTMIVNGNANEQAPDAAEMDAFNQFIAQLDGLSAGLPDVRKTEFRLKLAQRLIPAMPRTIGRAMMGLKFADDKLCTRCGTCVKVCPYAAIQLKDLPQFDQKKCYGCWACYNHCPTKAIYTKKFRGVGHYPEPIAAVRRKLEF